MHKGLRLTGPAQAARQLWRRGEGDWMSDICFISTCICILSYLAVFIFVFLQCVNMWDAFLLRLSPEILSATSLKLTEQPRQGQFFHSSLLFVKIEHDDINPNQVRWGNRDDERREDVVQWSSILNLFWSERLQSTQQKCSIQYLFNSQSWKWPHSIELVVITQKLWLLYYP